MRACLVLFILVSIARAAESCPWLNAATAGGILDGAITSMTVEHARTADDATCTFVRREGSRVLELRIEVGPSAARCPSGATPLRAIGNEALACSVANSGGLAEQVSGRVRDRAFAVRIGTTGNSPAAAVLREKVRNIAEQVAGILF